MRFEMKYGISAVEGVHTTVKIIERNRQVRQLLDDLYKKAENQDTDIDESAYKQSIDRLFDTTTWGFREILLVVVIGMQLDRTYRASSGLYNCNPRAIYEGPIKEFLIEKHIPHRKSGPLNVAKATIGLNESWAAQRRPAVIAEEVVRIIKYMEEDPDKRDERVLAVGVSIMRRFISCSDHLESLSVNLRPSADPYFLYHLCYKLITKTPDAGNTPQKIVAFLLKHYHCSMQTGIVVTGEKDRASVASTTSKKPGDVNEESMSGEIFKVYEVTVKKFDIKRIRDSYDCIHTYNRSNHTDIHEVIVICRPEDCPKDIDAIRLQGYNLHECLGSYKYRDIIYYYWNINEWILSMLQRMTANARTGFYKNLNSYIEDINTAENVKILWKRLHTACAVQ